MKYSKLFCQTTKNVPADETALNAKLLIQAGYVNKAMAGVYNYTPLGLRVLEKIKQIVREEMDAVGGQELIMSSLQKKSTWQQTNRWDDKVVDVWFKSQLKDGAEVGFGWSHEEPIIEMIKQYLSSYKDLPINVYQFQNKLRNELRAKSGIMRGREFLMKDMYSCSLDEKQHQAFYNSVIEAYLRIFDRLGIGDDTFVTFASGGAFTEFSHEFQTICPAGEDYIYLNKQKKVAINDEIMSEQVLQKFELKKDDFERVKTAEVGNIFNFGTHKSEQMKFKFTNKEGRDQLVHLGSYGIGITRVMGVIVEKFADDKGLVWPKQVAPYQVYLIGIGDSKRADDLYQKLTELGVEVLYDDRDIRPGQKFADADLVGLPFRVVTSDRLGDQLELVSRGDKETKILTFDQLVDRIVGTK